MCVKGVVLGYWKRLHRKNSIVLKKSVSFSFHWRVFECFVIVFVVFFYKFMRFLEDLLLLLVCFVLHYNNNNIYVKIV